MRSLPRSAAVYICAVTVAALAITVAAVGHGGFAWPQVLFFAALYWIGDFAPVTTKLKPLGMSTSFPVALAAALLLGPWSAAVVCVLGTALRVARSPWYKRAFNSSQVALCAFAAGYVYTFIPGSSVGFTDVHFPAVFLAVGCAGLAYSLINHLLVAVVINRTTDMPLANVWWGGMSETAWPSLGYGLIGLMIAVMWAGGVGPVAALLVLAPMLVARWAIQQYAEQHKAYEATVASLIRAVETKDYYTRGHSERVAQASVLIAEQLGMREDRLEMLRYAGMLHDVGKLGVPTKLLQKTGPLDDSEFAAIRMHPSRGFEMINGISFLDEAVLGVKHHHERVDGLGYPDGLSGHDIPEFARVIAVADAFDSMTSTRSYRSARKVDAAVAELRRWAGTQFDAVMVEALITAVEQRGWEPNVAATDEVVDPAAIAFVDHDDPSRDLAAAFGYGSQLQTKVS
ncbi:MAG: HD-GYP domain-containing protein [Acidothermaceae bacterium]